MRVPRELPEELRPWSYRRDEDVRVVVEAEEETRGVREVEDERDGAADGQNGPVDAREVS